jgi:hypothetical protein
LPHFYFYPEFFGVNLYQFAKIYAVVGNIKEGGFATISLNFNLGQFHFEVQLAGNGPGPDEGFFFAVFILLPDLNVFIGGAAQHFFNVGVGFVGIPFLHLQANDFAGNVYSANIEPAYAFNGNQVAFFKNVNSGVSEEVFPASIIEGYFYDLTAARRIAEWQVAQPIVHIHPVTTARAASAIAFTAGYLAASSA